ncbi:hypothetical protein HPP92_019513 [Vanilla planifolia]|uniref:ABC transporter domain-containing protein n=1 Tax=Vanilla planifolia TaxID=51239 RepID=A0A835Q475_VANPL|nr:hypothetical protein HPP92_019513 [Vanilla planifolia]
MGISGAGKTTLMDVLAGRKTGGYIEGSIMINGYPKKQKHLLEFQHGLGCPSEVDINKRKMFIEEVMELVELTPLRGTLVGLPGRNRALVKELSILLSWFKRSLLSKHNTPSPLFHNALLAFETKLVIWRTPPFSATRFFFTLVVALFGTIFWDLGGKREYLCGGGGTTGHALFHMDTLWIGNLLQFGDLEEKD